MSLMFNLKKLHRTQDHLVFSILFSKKYIILYFKIRYMFHFELIFVKGKKSVYICFFLYQCPVVLESSLRNVFSPLYCLSCQKSVDYIIYVGQLLGSILYFIFYFIELFVYSFTHAILSLLL